MLHTKEHDDLMRDFESWWRKQHGERLDREARAIWPKGNIYQHGETNAAFLAFRAGYAYGKRVWMA